MADELETSAIETANADHPKEKPAEEKPAENTEGEAASKSTEEKPVEGEAEVKPEEKKPEDNSVIRQMRKMIRQQSQKIATLEQQMQTPKPQAAPLRENYVTEAEYTDAKVTYEVGRSLHTAKQVQSDPLQQKFSEARKTHADFDEVISDIDHVQFKPESQDALRQAVEVMEFGSEILYHLAKNPDVAEELSILPPAAFAVKLGEIHGEIKRSKTAPPQKSKAPAPITPVSGNTKPEKSYDDMTDDEFVKQRRKEQKAHAMRYV